MSLFKLPFRTFQVCGSDIGQNNRSQARVPFLSNSSLFPQTPAWSPIVLCFAAQLCFVSRTAVELGKWEVAGTRLSIHVMGIPSRVSQELVAATALPGGQHRSHLHHASLLTAVWFGGKNWRPHPAPKSAPERETTASSTASPPRAKL